MIDVDPSNLFPSNDPFFTPFWFHETGSNKLLGDLLCIAGATFYGISNVGQEYIVRSFDRVEFLGMLGFFGSIINGIQL